MTNFCRKKGFTLVETVIGLVVFLVLAGAASAVIVLCFDLLGRGAMRNKAQSIGDGVYNLIENRISYCQNLTISTYDPITGEINYYDGMNPFQIVLARGGKTVELVGAERTQAFSASDLGGMYLDITLEEGESYGLVRIVVEVFEDGSNSAPLYHTEGSACTMNAVDTFIDIAGSFNNCGGDVFITFTEIG